MHHQQQDDVRRVRNLLLGLQPVLAAQGIHSAIYRPKLGETFLPIMGLAFEVVGTLADAAAVIVSITTLAEERGCSLDGSIEEVCAPHVVEPKACAVFTTITATEPVELRPATLVLNVVN